MTDHADLKRRAQKICEMLANIADLREDLKLEKKGAESAGYDIKALMQVVKELRNPEKHEAQLELELVLDSYREGVGLKTRSGEGKVVELPTRRRTRGDGAGVSTPSPAAALQD